MSSLTLGKPPPGVKNSTWRKWSSDVFRAHAAAHAPFPDECTVWSTDADVIPLHRYLFKRQHTKFFHVWTGQANDLRSRNRTATGFLTGKEACGQQIQNFFFHAAAASMWRRVFPADTPHAEIVKKRGKGYFGDMSYLNQRWCETNVTMQYDARTPHTRGTLYPKSVARGDLWKGNVDVRDFMCYHHGPEFRTSLTDFDWTIMGSILEQIVNSTVMNELELLRKHLTR